MVTRKDAEQEKPREKAILVEKDDLPAWIASISQHWQSVITMLDEVLEHIPPKVTKTPIDVARQTAVTERLWLTGLTPPRRDPHHCPTEGAPPVSLDHVCRRTNQMMNYVIGLLRGFCVFLKTLIPPEERVTVMDVKELCHQLDKLSKYLEKADKKEKEDKFHEMQTTPAE